MNASRQRRQHVFRASRRVGLTTFGELLLIVSTLTGALWLGTRFMAVVMNVSASSATTFQDSSAHAVYRISLEADGQMLWVYRPKTGVERLNLVTSEVDRVLALSGMELWTLAHSLDGSTTLLCGLDDTCLLLRDGDASRSLRTRFSSISHADHIVGALVSAHGDLAFCVTKSGCVTGWKRDESGERELSYELSSGADIVRVHLSCSHRLFVGRVDGTVSIHDPGSGESTGRPFCVGHPCTAFAWSRDERFVAVITPDGQLRAYDTASRGEVYQAQVDAREIVGERSVLEFSPDGTKIAVATNAYKEIRVWELAKHQPPKTLRGHSGFVRTLQFSPSSERLYSGSYDGTIREWSLETGSPLRIFN